MENDKYQVLQKQMVEEQLKARYIRDQAVLNAMSTIPRHRFVPLHLEPAAYDDGPLPIGEGQTISQPYIVALMAEAAELTKDSVVLEIGTGSGYSAAVLSKCAQKVYTIERIASLAQKAEHLIKELRYSNIYVTAGDGTLGWPEHAPFDAIVVTAGAPVIPESLAKQLKIGGRLIIPVGDAIMGQELIRIRKITENDLQQERLCAVRFVPLIGKEGWHI